MKWAHYDSTGKIAAIGECPDGLEHLQLDASSGLMLYLGEAELHDFIDTTTGALIKGVKPAPSHRELRAAEYPPIEAQLDALWHAMDRGDLPKAPEFYTMIKRVKDRHPNPNAIGVTEL